MRSIPSPFLRYVLWLMAGMLLANYLPLPQRYALLLLLISLLCLSGLVYFLMVRRPLKGYAVGAGLTAGLLLLAMGYLRLNGHQQSQDLTQKIFSEQAEVFLFRLDGPVEQKANSWLLPGRVQAVRDSAGNWQAKEARLMLYFSARPVAELQAGQRLLVKATPHLIVSHKNPLAFDYARYARQNHLYWQAFAKTYLLLDSEDEDWRMWLEARRSRMANLLMGYFPDKTAGILQALVLGYRHEIEQEVEEAFAGTGTLHILAVSGLHVGLVYGILLWLFGHYRYSKTGRWLFPLLSGLCLFLYAGLTGFAPSVLRAALMFWLFAVADGLQGGRNRLNTLALSAFILLLIEPHLLFTAGFQLSYAAVLGIILLVPSLSAPFRNSNIFVYRLGQLLAVTLAAQLFTFSISLYYFGQFPVYFFLANLLVVPLAGLLLYGGLLVLLLHTVVPALAALLATLINSLLMGLLWYMGLLQALPSSQLNVYVTLPESCLLYGLIGLLLAAWFYRKKLFLLLTGLSFLLLIAMVNDRLSANNSLRRLIVYQQSGNSIIHLLAGRRELILATDSVKAATEAFLLQPVRRAYQLRQPLGVSKKKELCRELEEGTLCFWQGMAVLQLSRMPSHPPPPQPLPVDVLVISNNALWKAADILDYYMPKTVVLDGSNSKFRREKLGKAFKSFNFELHDTARQGAYTYYF